MEDRLSGARELSVKDRLLRARELKAKDRLAREPRELNVKDRLLPVRELRARYGVSNMALWRGPRETDCGSRERRAAENSAKANVDIAALELIDVRAPRGRRGRHVRTECAAKARNRSRVA